MTRASAAKRVGIVAALTAALMFAVADAQAHVCDRFHCGEMSANAGYAASSAKSPTLTNDIGQPREGAEWQLPVGLGLLAAGLLGVVYGLATIGSTRRRAIAHAGARTNSCRSRRDTTMIRQPGSGG